MTQKNSSASIRGFLLAVAIAVPVLPRTTHAATATWVGGTNGAPSDWATPSNWNPANPPGLTGSATSGDTAVFNSATNLTVTPDPARNIRFITFDTGAGAFTLTNSGSNSLLLTNNGNITINAGVTNSQTINTPLILSPSDNSTYSLINNSTASGVNLVIGGTVSTSGTAGASVLTVGGNGNGVISGLLTNGTANAIGLTKNGLGRWTLSSSNNNITGPITINGGVLDLGGNGVLSSGSAGTLTLGNGELSIGVSSGPRSQLVGALNFNAGRNTITLSTISASATTNKLTADSLGTRAVGAVEIFRGTNLGTAAPNTANVANILFTNAPVVSSSFGAFANTSGASTVNTPTTAVIRGALISTTATGSGSSFATYDPSVGVRALRSSEQDTTYPAADTSTNVKLTLSGATSITGVTTNTLQLDNNSGAAVTVTNSGTLLNPANGLLFSGTSAINLSGGTLTFNGGGATADAIVLSTNTAGVTISSGVSAGSSGNRSVTFGGSGDILVTGQVTIGGGGGVFYDGTGTLTLSGAYAASSAGVNINSGTVKLGSGFAPTNQGNSIRPLKVASGATMDLSGISTSFEYLSDLTGGGTITNSGSATSTLTLTFVNSASTGIGNSTFSGSITGNINLIENAAASVTTSTQLLAGTNSYTGSTTISNGNMRIGVNNALPTTTSLTVDGTSATPGSVLDLGGFNQIVASLAGTVTSGSATITNTLNGTSTLTVNGTTSTSYAGVLTDTGSNGILALTKAGSGTLALSGSNNYAGGTTINGGTIKANGLSSTGTGAVIVNSNGTLAGTGTAAGAVTVNAGGHLAPGDNGIGTLTTGSLTLSGSSILDFELASSSSRDRVVVANTDGLTINGGLVNLFQPGTSAPFSTPGVYDLIQYLGNLVGVGSNALSVSNPGSFRNYSFGSTGTTIRLTITTTAVTSTWIDGSGSWGDGTKWNTNPTIPNTPGAGAVFNAPSPAGAAIVTLDGDKTVGDLTINTTNPNTYTFTSGTGGTLILDNGSNVATITNNGGSNTIAAPVALSSSNAAITVSNAANTLTISGPVNGIGGIIKSGSGTLALTASNSYSGGTTLSGGITQIGSNSSFGATGGILSISTATLEALNNITTNRNVQLTGASTIQVDGTSTYQINGNVANPGGAGSLAKNGPGTLILNGNSVSTGVTAIQSGTLQIGAGPNSGSATVALVSGQGGFNVNGSAVTLSGSNTAYSGQMSVTSGTLTLATNSTTATGTGSLILNNSTLAAATSTTIGNNATSATTAAGFLTIAVQGTVAIDTGANTLTLASQLSGSNASIIRNAGTGTLALGVSGNTTFTNNGFAGNFTSTVGNVSFVSRNAGSLSTVFTFTGGGTVSLGNPGGTINLGGLAGTNSISAAGTARMRVGDAGVDTTYSGVIGTAGATSIGLFKSGTGTLTLGGQNLYAGQALTAITGASTVIASGTLAAASSSLGAASGPFGPTNGVSPIVGTSTGLILLGNNGVLANAGLATNGAVTVTNPIVVSSGTGANSGAVITVGGLSDNNSTIAGPITLENDLTVTQAATTGGHALTLASDIEGTAAGTGPANTATTGTGSTANTGVQTVTFAGPGAINVTGTISNGYSGFIVQPATAVNVRATGGTTTLSGVMTYTGTTSVNGGTLVIATSLSGTSMTTVTDGGVLAGTGTAGIVNILATTGSSGGAIDPGLGGASVAANGAVTGNNATGTLTTSDLNLAAGAHIAIQLSGSTAGTFDQVSVNGSVTLAGDLQGSLLNGYRPKLNDKFFIILNDGSDSINGTFSNVAQNGTITFGDGTFRINYNDNGDNSGGLNDVSLTTIAVVPEPTTWAMALSGVTAIAALRARRRRRN